MRALRMLVAWLLFLSGACSAIRADVLTLTDGRTVCGTIERPAGSAGAPGEATVEIVTVRGVRLRIPSERVLIVERWAECLDTYGEWREMAHTADDWTICGDWCASKGSPIEAETCWKRAIELDPDHSTARSRLGHRQVDGRWVVATAAPPAPAPPARPAEPIASRANPEPVEVGSPTGAHREAGPGETEQERRPADWRGRR